MEGANPKMLPGYDPTMLPGWDEKEMKAIARAMLENGQLWYVGGFKPEPGSNLDEWQLVPIHSFNLIEADSEQRFVGMGYIHINVLEHMVVAYKLRETLMKIIELNPPNAVPVVDPPNAVPALAEEDESGLDDSGVSDTGDADEISDDGQDPNATSYVEEVAGISEAHIDHDEKERGEKVSKKKGINVKRSKGIKKRKKPSSVWPFVCACGKRFGKKNRLDNHCKRKPLEHYPASADDLAQESDPQSPDITEMAGRIQPDASE